MEEWDEIREDYNKNKEKYKFKEEDINFSELLDSDNNNIKDKKLENNSIDQMFNDIIEYE